MFKDERNYAQTQFALAVARGGSAREWARTHNLSVRTIQRWAKQPAVREIIERYRWSWLGRPVGRSSKSSPCAVELTIKIAEDGEHVQDGGRRTEGGGNNLERRWSAECGGNHISVSVRAVRDEADKGMKTVVG